MIVLAAVLALAVAWPASASAASTPGSFTLVRPYNYQQISGRFKVRTQIRSSALRKVKGVEFWLDGTRIGTDRRAPFSVNLDTTRFSNGTHKLSANLVTRKTNKQRKKGPRKQLCLYEKTILVRITNKAAKSAAAKPVKPAVPAGIESKKSQWKVIFEDDFNGTALDTSKWGDQRNDWMTGGNPYNDRESAWYMPGNNQVGGGVLTQTVRHEQQGSYGLTTGMITSNHRFQFKYGYVEARVKVPSCVNCWPVFWALPYGGIWPPEMDIFEYIDTASSQRTPFLASHWSENGTFQSSLAYYPVPCGTATDYIGSYHTYGLLWTPKRIQAYLDGVPGPKFTGAAVPQAQMYLVMMLSTGEGQPPAGSPQMETDFIRVWQQQPR